NTLFAISCKQPSYFQYFTRNSLRQTTDSRNLTARIPKSIFRRSLQSKLLHHHLKVLPCLALLPRITQQKRRMVSHRHLRPTTAVPAPSQPSQRLFHTKQV